MSALRIRAWLAGVWAGGLLAIALIAAPALFALLPRAQAGLVAGRLFHVEALASLGFAVVLLLVERGIAQREAAAGRGSRFSVELVLVLIALFCTVAGAFALQPLFELARAGKGPLSFAAIHTISMLLYALKTVLVLALAWRSGPA